MTKHATETRGIKIALTGHLILIVLQLDKNLSAIASELTAPIETSTIFLE